MKVDSPEVELLLICLHDPISSQQSSRAQGLIAAGIDVHALGELAAQNNIEMLLYQGLLQFRSQELQPLISRLEEQLTTDALIYEFVYPQQLADVVTVFESAGIETLVLKGYVLGQVVYGQPVLRPYGDFDILVHEAQLENAETCLQQLGYVPDEREHPRAWYYENPFHHIVPYMHDERLTVEVHRNLSYNHFTTDLRINLDAVWAHAVSFTVNGASTRILCPEHQLVYICLHAVNVHLFVMGLKPLVDVYKILQIYKETLDWSLVVDTAADWRCTRQIYLVLRLVTAVFDIDVPDLQQFGITAFDPRFMDYSLQNVLGATMVGWDTAHVLQERDVQHISRLMRRRLFPPRADLAERFGLASDDWRVWFYYPVWQAGTIRRVASSVWRLLRQDQAAIEMANQESVRRAMLKWLGGSPETGD